MKEKSRKLQLVESESWFVDEFATCRFEPSFSTGKVVVHSYWDLGFPGRREWWKWKRLFRKWRRRLRKTEKKK